MKYFVKSKVNMFSDKVESVNCATITAWLKENFGENYGLVGYDAIDLCIGVWFDNEEDAITFKLRWG